MSDVIEQLRGAAMTVLADYDGTLVPIAPTPDLATPDAELIDILAALAAAPHIDVHIVSGRPAGDLYTWFGQLSIGLWAEHGMWHRPPSGDAWQKAIAVPREWLDKLRPILQHVTDATPGSALEEKSGGFAWHYRRAEPAFAKRQAGLLRALLADALRGSPFEVCNGKKTIEVRLQAIHKGLVADRVIASVPPASRIVAIGDDETDADLFAALPGSAVTIAVGSDTSNARYVVPDHHAVRDLLRSLISPHR